MIALGGPSMLLLAAIAQLSTASSAHWHAKQGNAIVALRIYQNHQLELFELAQAQCRSSTGDFSGRAKRCVIGSTRDAWVTWSFQVIDVTDELYGISHLVLLTILRFDDLTPCTQTHKISHDGTMKSTQSTIDGRCGHRHRYGVQWRTSIASILCSSKA